MSKRALPFIDYELPPEFVRALLSLCLPDVKNTTVVKSCGANPRNPSIYGERPSESR